jgi:invasion protein IalB
MILSKDLWNTPRRGARSALLTALALGLGTSLAMAQQVPAVPKTPAPPKGAAPAAAPGQGGEAWVKVCKNNEQTGNKQLCLVTYEGVDPNTGTVLDTVAVRSIEGEDKQSLLIGLTTAYALIIPAGVQIKIDDSEPISLLFDVCFSPSCQAHTELTKEIFDKMRKGKQIIVAAINLQQKTMAFQVPLTGFGKAFDGPPVDNAKYEEAHRQMMEKFRQRQIDLANKVAEQKKVPGAEESQVGAPPQAGAQIPAQPAP